MTTCLVPLTQGKSAEIDIDDFDWLSASKWYLTAYGYAARSAVVDGKRGVIYMHRLILNAPKGTDVDHIDGNRVNNSRRNLRLCTRLENLQNSKKRDGTASRHKGVDWLSANHKWRARIRHHGKTITLGCFATEGEAALAYNEAAINLFGPFAKLNKFD